MADPYLTEPRQMGLQGLVPAAPMSPPAEDDLSPQTPMDSPDDMGEQDMEDSSQDADDQPRPHILQIAQMAVGVAACVYIVVRRAAGVACDDARAVAFATAMYASYLALFVSFYTGAAAARRHKAEAATNGKKAAHAD